MATQGTTPRRLTDLIGSLCDLTSGSGDKGTPIIFIQGYFNTRSSVTNEGDLSMEPKQIFAHIDHTLLRPDASWRQMQTLCQEALDYGAASVCIPPSYVERVRKDYPSLPITTVVGFPLGNEPPAVKCFAASEALHNGANEIDMVINLGDVANRAFHRVLAEIQVIRQTIEKHVLKVIIETCYLDDRDKAELCRVISAAGADYIKTSTGFGSAGAQISDVLLFRQHLDPAVKIKAAGGIRTREEMEAFLEAGADRLGCSGAVPLSSLERRRRKPLRRPPSTRHAKPIRHTQEA